MTDEKLLIKVSNLKKSFNTVWALNGVSLKLHEGYQYVIRGASGSGKSTLLYLLGGLDRPTHGDLWIGDRKLAEYSDDELAHYRNRFIGFVFQFHFLLPSMNCLDNMLLPGRIGGIPVKDYKSEILELSDHLGVSHVLNKFPYQLSGGEQQRINIIRALSLRPKLLLCDEPTGNLDSGNSKKVIGLLKELALTNRSTLVVVTHDEGIASTFSNQFYMEDGVLVPSHEHLI